MNMNYFNSKKSLQALALATVTVLGYQNCGPGVLTSSDQASTTAASTFTVNDQTSANGMTEVIDSKAYGVSYSENTFNSMLNQTGVAKPSKTTLNAVASQFAKMPESGKADSVTAPMWVALTTVSGEVCNDLTVQEKALTAANRRFFGLVDFTKAPTALTQAAKDDVIRRLARSIWARNETVQEKTLIEQSFDATFSTSTTVADTQNGMFFLCTAMLASLDANKY